MTTLEQYRISIEDVEERAVAAFLGFAIGDALGATAEFMTPSEIRAEYGVLRDICGGGWLRLPAGAVTDDTEMSLCIARSLVAVGFSPRDIAIRFANWLKSRPRDVGGTCRRGIRRFLTEGTLFADPNEADAGNGAAMRIVPVALATLGDSQLFASWALQQAHITHHHPLSDAACLVLGQLLQLALVGHDRTRLQALSGDFLSHYPLFAYEKASIQSSAYVVDTLRVVLHAFFSTRSFEECLIESVNRGGDADTVGAISGALAGAYYGFGSIPSRWLTKLDRSVRRELEQVSPDLVALSPLSSSTSKLEISRRFLHAAVECALQCGSD